MNKILLAQMATLHSLSYPEHYIVQIYSFKLLKNNFDITIPIDNSPILVKVLNNKIKVNVPYFQDLRLTTKSCGASFMLMTASNYQAQHEGRNIHSYTSCSEKEDLLIPGALRAWALSLSKLETI